MPPFRRPPASGVPGRPLRACSRPPRYRRRLALLLATAAAILALPAAAQALPGPGYYGVNIQPLIKETLVTPAMWGPYINVMGSDGLTTARMDAEWRWVEPNAPSAAGVHSYSWTNAADP